MIDSRSQQNSNHWTTLNLTNSINRLKKSFEAWQARFKSDPHGNNYKNHLLSGLEDYSREQLYYMAFARVWCSNRRPASAIEGVS